MPVRTRAWRRCNRAARAIQRAWRLHKAIDPITLGPVKATGGVFRHVDARSGYTSFLSAVPLAECFAHTGDFRHPITRAEMNRAEVLRLQHAARKSGAELDLMAGMDVRQAERRERLEAESLRNFLADELVGAGADMVRVVSDHRRDAGDVVAELQDRVFAAFHAAVHNLRAVDASNAAEIGRGILGDLNTERINNAHPIASRLARSYVTLSLINLDVPDVYQHPMYRLIGREGAARPAPPSSPPPAGEGITVPTFVVSSSSSDDESVVVNFTSGPPGLSPPARLREIVRDIFHRPWA